MGVNFTLNDFTSPGCRRRLYTYGLVEPSMNPVLVFIKEVCQTNGGTVTDKPNPCAASAADTEKQLILEIHERRHE